MLDLTGYCKHEGKQCRGSGWENTESTIINGFAGVIWNEIFANLAFLNNVFLSSFVFCISKIWCIVIMTSFDTTLPIISTLDCLSAGTHCKSCFLQAWWEGNSRLLCHSHMCASEGTIQVYTTTESGEFLKLMLKLFFDLLSFIEWVKILVSLCGKHRRKIRRWR